MKHLKDDLAAGSSRLLKIKASVLLLYTNVIQASHHGLPFENQQITPEKIMAGIFCAGVYFIPSIVARDKVHFGRIAAFNLLVGWTIFGWLVALIWALRADVRNPKPPDPDEDLDEW